MCIEVHCICIKRTSFVPSKPEGFVGGYEDAFGAQRWRCALDIDIDIDIDIGISACPLHPIWACVLLRVRWYQQTTASRSVIVGGREISSLGLFLPARPSQTIVLPSF